MAIDIHTQVNTIERALGERMIMHALTILRSWLAEQQLTDYDQRLDDVEKQYKGLFSGYLSWDDPEREQALDALTGTVYRLADEIYADLRLRRGDSPTMTGFNPENEQSVVNYFTHNLRLSVLDYEWLRTCVSSPETLRMGLAAIFALSEGLKQAFSEQALLFFIEMMSAEQEEVKRTAMLLTIMHLAQYDVRIDFFPEVEQAFQEAIGDGSEIFAVLITAIETSQLSVKNMLEILSKVKDELPEEIRNVLGDGLFGIDGEAVVEWRPQTEQDFLAGIVSILPDTWVLDTIVGEDDERERTLDIAYLSIGRMDLLWNEPAVAEEWLVERLRSGAAEAVDYLNYGHCCFMRGDRMMAYENYREARQRLGSAKAFMALFRPQRRLLVEAGIPVEQVYLMEDQMLRI